jgi:chromodomain-helicase-DNA-binding protein 7
LAAISFSWSPSRKKYVDDIDLSLSDEDATLPAPAASSSAPVAVNENSQASASGACASAEPVAIEVADPEVSSQSGVKPNFVYVNTTDEDTMVVQVILQVRTGTREIVSSDEEDEEDEAQKEAEKEAQRKKEEEEKLRLQKEKEEMEKNREKPISFRDVDEIKGKFVNFLFLTECIIK